MSIDPVKLAELQAMAKPAVAEILAVEWDADTTVYYAIAQFDHLMPHKVGLTLTPIETRLTGGQFHAFELNGDLRTENIKFTFSNTDKAITAKFQEFGAGVRCELFYWYPEVDLLVSQWWGQLGAPEGFDYSVLPVTATNGLLSREILLGRRMRPNECAFTYGELFTDITLLAKNGCPANITLGGDIGNGDPDCSRLSEAVCIEHLGTAKYYGGFRWDVGAIRIDGGNSVTKGSGSILKTPIRIIFGQKKLRNLPLLFFRRELNAQHPEDGFVRGVFEIGEGPLSNIYNIKLNDRVIGFEHIQIRLGQRGQTSLPQNLWPNIPNMSFTGHFSAALGPVDPGTVTPTSFKAECDVTGYNQVGVYTTTPEGQGLLGTYYNDTTFGAVAGQRVDSTINFPSQVSAPLPGMPLTNFSIKWVGQIKPRYSETYTFTALHDDSVTVTIDGDEIINEVNVGTHTGTKALLADVLYDIEVTLVQGAASGNHPWACVFSWESASQSFEVVPNSRLFTEEVTGFVPALSTNRVWCLLEGYTNVRWGRSYSHARFNIPDWIECAEWSYDGVTFTGPDGTEYPHIRSTFNAILEGRPTQEVITDICRSGRISIPFQHDGKYTIKPYRKYTDVELAAVPVFTDRGPAPNILWADGQPTLRLSKKDDKELINKVVLNFEDAANDDVDRPLTIEDPNQQAVAGKALGISAFQEVERRFSAFGVNNFAEAWKLGHALLYFGEFDEGGIKNNCRAEFDATHIQVLGQMKVDVVKIDSAQLDGWGYTDPITDVFTQFEYFRILEMPKDKNNVVHMVLQAYNHVAYEDFEADNATPPAEPSAPDPYTVPEDPVISSFTHDGEKLTITLA